MPVRGFLRRKLEDARARRREERQRRREFDMERDIALKEARRQEFKVAARSAARAQARREARDFTKPQPGVMQRIQGNLNAVLGPPPKAGRGKRKKQGFEIRV